MQRREAHSRLRMYKIQQRAMVFPCRLLQKGVAGPNNEVALPLRALPPTTSVGGEEEEQEGE